MSDFIKLRNIVKVYGSGANSFLALKGIDLDINKGEFVALMGQLIKVPLVNGKKLTGPKELI